MSVPGGADTNVQYNDSGAFGGDANLVWNKANQILRINGNEPRLQINEADRTTDGGLWDIDVQGGIWSLRTRTDADAAGQTLLSFQRGGVNVDNFTFNLGPSKLTVFAGDLIFEDSTGAPALAIIGTSSSNAAITYLEVVNNGTGGISTKVSSTTFAGPMIANGPSGQSVATSVVGGIPFSFAIDDVEAYRIDTAGNFTHNNAIADKSYSYQAPATGFSITIANNITSLILDPAGTLATGTIAMPATPIDGQIVRASSSQIITTLTVAASAGQSIKNAPTTLAAGDTFAYIYRSTNTTWYRYP